MARLQNVEKLRPFRGFTAWWVLGLYRSLKIERGHPYVVAHNPNLRDFRRLLGARPGCFERT